MSRSIVLSLSLRRRTLRIAFAALAFAAGFVFLSTPSSAFGEYSGPLWIHHLEQPAQDTVKLKVGEPIERELAASQTHSYQITLASDQFAHVVVDQRGIDVEITLTMPDGSRITADSQNGSYGPEPVMWIALAAGIYRLEVRTSQGAGRYEIKLAALKPAGQAERTLAEAFKLYNQSMHLFFDKKYDEAITIGERARAVHEKALGADHPDVALTLFHLARLYTRRAALSRQNADYALAEPLLRNAISNWEKEWGKDRLGLRRPLTYLAEIYKEIGDIAREELLLDRVLKMCERLLPDDHIDLAHSRFNLGELLKRKRDYEKAEALLEKALKTFEARNGPRDNATLNCRAVLANVYTFHDKYSQAELLFQKQLQILTERYGANDLNVAELLNNFATLYFEKGDLDKAAQQYLSILRIREAKLRPNHYLIARSCESLSDVYVEAGDYVRAEPLLERALSIFLQASGADSDVAFIRQKLGVFYFRKGDYLKAEEQQKLSLEIRQRRLPPDHPYIAYSLDNLGVVYAYQGKHALAEQHFKDALKIRRKLETDHPGIAFALNHLAELYLSQNDFARAEPLFKEAVGIIERRRGTDNPLTANFLFDLAMLYHKKGDYTQADQLYRQVLRVREQLLGVDHLEVGTTLYNLALLNRAKGNMAHAVELLTRCNEMRERHLSRMLAAGSERQKLAYLNTFEHEANDAVSLHAVYAPGNSKALNLAFTTLLRRKGRGLDAFTDALAQFRRRATEPERAVLDQLASARSQFTTMALRGSSIENADAYRTRIQQLSAEIDKLESDLSAHNAEIKTEPVTVEAVQAAIPQGSALVEFTRYRPRARLSGDSGPPRYAAYILAHQGQPRWVDLGEAEPIRQAIEKWRRPLGNGDSKDVRQLARVVDKLVMSRVRALLGGTRHVLISPDAEINLIPFAALVDEKGRYLIERYSFTYVTSGRDLLRLQLRRPSQSGPLIVAVKEFGGETVAERASTRSDDKRDQNKRLDSEWQNPIGNFLPLPFVEDEAQQIKKIFPEASIKKNEQASETALKRMNGPSLLHIATHGYFLDDLKIAYEDTFVIKPSDEGAATYSGQQFNEWLARGENPWLRSGLALAGANLRQSGEDDGLLTALEAAGLDLQGTKLVVLSACETGLGNVSNGEGVYGLRRALVLAGAESQVVSLWKISAEGMTGNLMIDYYYALKLGQGRSEALRQAQLKMIRRHPHPFFWAAFIPVGEWANLDGQRPASSRQAQSKR